MKKEGINKKNIIITIVVALVVGVLLLRSINSHFGNKLIPEGSSPEDNTVASLPPETSNTLDNVETDLEVIEVNEEFLSSMSDKELIHYKMINAVDFFDAVEGEINQFGVYHDGTTKFIVDNKNYKSLIKINLKDKNADRIYNNGKAIEKNNIDNTIRNIKILNEPDKWTELNKLKPKQRYNGNGVFQSRNGDLFTGINACIYSNDNLSIYLKDYDGWNIDGSEEYVERVCTKISGKRDVVDRRTKAETFSALIDSETGVILKYDDIDGQGNIVGGFTTTYIKYNESYDPQLFEISNYTN